MVGLPGSGDVERASLWRRLAALERAGVPIQQNLATVVDQGGLGDTLLRTVKHDLDEGLGMDVAFGRAPLLEELERRIITAGAKSGRLPEVLEDLATHFEERAATKRAIVMSVAYPLFILHAAAVLPNVPLLVSKGTTEFLHAVLVPLLTAYAVVIALVLGWRALRSGSRTTADAIVLRTPLLGGLAQKRSLSAGLDVMRLLYASGVSVIDAAEAAAASCPNAVVGAAFTRARQRMIDGQTIAQAFVAEPMIPSTVQGLISSGATSGALDDLLGRAARMLDDDAKLARKALLAVLGTVAFLIAAGLVAYKVISFYADFYGQLNKAF